MKLRWKCLSVAGTDFKSLPHPFHPYTDLFGQSQGKRFEKFARLTSVLQLKLSNTVDEILQIRFETPEF